MSFRRLIFLLVLFFVLAGLTASGAVIYLLSWSQTPQENQTQQEIRFEIKTGQSLTRIAANLHSSDLIDHPELFRLFARWKGAASRVQAGNYLIKTTESPKEILEKFTLGKVILTTFTIPEGFNQWEVIATISKSFPHLKLTELEQLLSDRSLMASLPPEAVSLEGYLYPETYSFPEFETGRRILEKMLDTFQDRVPDELFSKTKKRGLTLHEAVTLASIVEKETGVPVERPEIAGVFFNRLKKRMKLQTDPTIIYGIWHRYDGNIRKKDILEATPYNTYVISGLPPGPIANPGLAALEAVATPKKTKALYFVSRGDGTHVFSKTLKEHNRNVRKYQLKR